MASISFQQTTKGVTFVVLCLLMAGYLAFNLWELPPSAIMAMRVASLLGIALLLPVDMPFRAMGVPILAIGLVSLLGVATSNLSLNLLFLCLTVLAFRKLNVDFIAASSAGLLAAAVIMSVVLIQLGWVINADDIAGDALELGGELRSRMTFGYRNVNAFASIVGSFCLLFMLTGRRAFLRYAVALLVSYTFYSYTDSRGMLIATVSFVGFTGIFLLARKRRELLRLLAGIVLIVPLVLSILAPLVVTEIPLLDLVLSGRLSFASSFFSDIPAYRLITGGTEPSSDTTVDNAFALLAGAMGVPLLLYLTYVTYQRLARSIDEGDFRVYSFLLAFWLYSFSESSMLRPESLICLIFWILVLAPMRHGLAKEGARQ